MYPAISVLENTQNPSVLTVLLEVLENTWTDMDDIFISFKAAQNYKCFCKNHYAKTFFQIVGCKFAKFVRV